MIPLACWCSAGITFMSLVFYLFINQRTGESIYFLTLKKSQEIKVIMFDPLRTMNVFDSSSVISTNNYIINLLVALQEKSKGHQSRFHGTPWNHYRDISLWPINLSVTAAQKSGDRHEDSSSGGQEDNQCNSCPDVSVWPALTLSRQLLAWLKICHADLKVSKKLI